MGLDLVLLQHRLVLVHLVANVALVLGRVLVRGSIVLFARRHRGIVVIQTIMFLQAAHTHVTYIYIYFFIFIFFYEIICRTTNIVLFSLNV